MKDEKSDFRGQQGDAGGELLARYVARKGEHPVAPDLVLVDATVGGESRDAVNSKNYRQRLSEEKGLKHVQLLVREDDLDEFKELAKLNREAEQGLEQCLAALVPEPQVVVQEVEKIVTVRDPDLVAACDFMEKKLKDQTWYMENLEAELERVTMERERTESRLDDLEKEYIKLARPLWAKFCWWLR